MANQYARGDRAWGICGRSGIKMLRRDMVFDGHYPNLLVHPDWYEGKHPQEELPKVEDPVALYRPAPETVLAPTTPILQATLNASDVTLVWTPAEQNITEMASYLLFRSIDGADFALYKTFPVLRDFLGGVKGLGGGATTSYTVPQGGEYIPSDTKQLADDAPMQFIDAGLSSGHTYCYFIQANPQGNNQSVAQGPPSPQSNEECVTLLAQATAPVLSGSVVGADVVLNWTASTIVGSTISNYEVHRQTDGGAFSLLTTVGNVLTYTDIAPAPGHTYGYFVVAIPVAGQNSANSNTVSETLSGASFSWTVRADPTASSNWIAVASDGTRAIAIGLNGNVLRTTDGINWALVTNLGAELNDITFAGGTWIICGSASFGCDGTTWRSTDNGSTWTVHGSLSGGSPLHVVGGTGTGIWIVARNFGDLSTDDGVTWNPSSGGTLGDVAPKIIFDGTHFNHATSDNISINALKLVTTAGTDFASSNMTELTTVPVTGLGWDGAGVFVATDGAVISRATATNPWNGVAKSTTVGNGWVQIGFGGSRFLVVGTSGKSTDSLDGGSTWSAPVVSGLASLEACCYLASAGLFVGVGSGLASYGP